MGAAPRTRRRRWRWLLLPLLSLGVLGLTAEIGLRAAGLRERALAGSVNRTNRRWVELLRGGMYARSSDLARRYTMRPGADVVVDGWRFRANRWRARGEDFPREKPAGEKRLLALGDSFCFGLWCDEDQTLVAQLARMANERESARGSSTHWRPINLGVPGYHSGQQLAALEQDGLALDPDVVLLYYNTNDIDRFGFFFDEELRALRADHLPLPESWKEPLWHSHLYGALVRAYDKLYAGRPDPPFDPELPWSHVQPGTQAVTRAAIERIAALCRERKIPLFFVNQPLLTWCGEARGPNWKGAELVAWAERLRNELGLPGISLLGWLRGYSDGIDRVAATAPGETPPPFDFYPERFLADEQVQKYFAGQEAERPDEPDFHLLGSGYADLARLCYPPMQAAGLLP